MSGLLHELPPAEPSHPPVNPTRPVPAGTLGHAVAQGAEPRDGGGEQGAQQADLFHRSAQGLRLAFVLGESGDEIWFAVCDRHAWLSIGGSRALAAITHCTCCEAEREAIARRARFVRDYGWLMWWALATPRPRS